MKHHIEFDLELRKNPYSGLYIVLEGTEASGKSTQVKKLAKYFEEQGREVILTREPRKEGIIGDMVHRILLGDLKLNPVAFQYLFSADRMLNHSDVIEPALKEGKVVISDRNFWSAVVYGILDRSEKDFNKTSMDQLLVAQSILSFYHQFIVPDITFYLKIPLDVSLKRLGGKSEAKEIYEDEDKIRTIIEGYDFVAKNFTDEITPIDGTQSIEQVTKDMVKSITNISKQ
jgi:dTMP kinase